MSEDAAVPSEITLRIGKPAARALSRHGITPCEQLEGPTSAALLEFHGVGQRAVRVLSEELAARGLAFAETQSE